MSFTYQSRMAKAQRRKFRSRLMHMERLEDRMVLTGASPVAINDLYLVVKDTPLVVTSPGVLTNDTDAESDPLTASIFSGPNHGSVTLDTNGSFTYTPTAGYTGLDSFLYLANDGSSNSKLAAVTLRVRSTGNQPPVAAPDSYSIPEDGILDVGGTQGVLANDTDPDGNPLTSVLVASSGPSHGTLLLNPNGGFNYVPDPNFHGTDTFSYQASDGSLLSAPAEVTITVTSEEDAPVAANDAYSTDEDTTLVIDAPGVLENDSDADEDPLSAVIVSPPLHGSLTLDADGNFVYIPDADFNGVDGFSYVASDGTSDSDVAAVMITVNSVNDDPVAENDDFSTAEDTLLTIPAPGVLGNDTDGDGDVLSISDFSSPAHGTLTLNPDGSLSYLPDADYFGPDAFAYQTTDGTSVSNFAAVTIDVTEVNDAPVANPDSATVEEDSTANVINVLGNDTTGPANESGQTLSVTTATAVHGTVIINSDGTLSYTPEADYFGSDTISYTITDDGTTPLTASSTVAVTVTEVNDAPVANPDSATVEEDSTANVINVLGNDTTGPANESGQTLSVTTATAEHGTVIINSDGTLSYTPEADYFGSDTISYTITDDGTTPLTASSTVAVTVTEVNDAPVANPDSATVEEDSTGNVINVLGNDTTGPANESGQTLSVTTATAEHGTVIINSDGTLSYTPEADYFGSDTISYTITDDGTTPLTASSTVAVTVTEVNDAPVANPDSATVEEDSTANVINVLGNDTTGPANESGQTLSVTTATAEHGTVIINSDGTLSYTPEADYFGSDTISYTITDDGTTPLTASSTVAVTVTEVNDAPVANPDSATVEEDSTANVINVLGNDTTGPANESGQTLSVTTATAVHGTVIINSDGTLSYTPEADYFGSDTISYTITDDGTTPLTASSTVAVTVTEVNDAPVANPDSATVEEDSTANVINVLGNDTTGPANESGQTLSVTTATAEHGTVIINSDGTLSYTPEADYFGSDTISYTITDDGTTPLTASSTVAVTVTEVNDAPVANPDSATVEEDSTANVINVLGNDTTGPANESGQTLSVTTATAEHGTVIINSDGTLSYTPEADYFGSDTISYTITDDGTTPLTASSTVAVTVTEVNDAPVANPDSATVEEDSTANVINVLGNDTTGPANESGQTLSVTTATAVHGTVIINSDGTLSYTPEADYFGSDTISYTITDDGTTPLTASSTVAVTVTEVNDAPVANPDSATVEEDSTGNVINVLGNDTTGPANESGQTLSVTTATAEHGTVIINSDGTLSYTPEADYFGSDTISYTITDDGTTPLTASSTVAVTVTEVNDAPVANPDSATVEEDSTGNVINVLGNDTTGPANESGQTLSVTTATAEHGTVIINSDGTLSYTPEADYFGSDTISYTITDDGTTPLTASSTVAVTVTEVNDAPVANPDSATVEEDSTGNVINVLGNDTTGPANESGQTLSVTTATAEHGTVIINSDGTLSYTPEADYFGSDTISYTITDDGTTPLTASSTVAVTVTNVNNAPVGINDDYATDEDATLTISAPGVLGNDTDADGDTLTVFDHTNPAHGTLTIGADGSFVYTPDLNYHGVDGFAYLAGDGTTESDWTAVTIEIVSVNDAPTAVDDTYSTATNVTLNVSSPGLLGNDSDVDGDVLSAAVVSPPAHGTVTLAPDGSFTYVPTPGFVGVDTFQYAASDGTVSTEATVTINVTGPNQRPVAKNDSYTVTQDDVLNVSAPGVLGNDSDPNGDTITAVLFPANPALPNRTSHGTVTLNSDGSFIYTPDAGFVGNDFFLYYATDGHLNSSFAAVTIKVVAPSASRFAALDGGGPGSSLISDGLLDLLAGDQTGTTGTNKKSK